MFRRIAAGAVSAAGASAAASATAVPSVVTTNLTAARPPSRTATMTASTARAGQAVYFIAQATPRTTAGCQLSPRRRVRSARARQVRAITGGSVMPMASGKAMTGDETAAAARPRARPRRPAVIRKVANSRPNVAAASQGRGSPRMPGRPRAFGRPKTAITGRYGL